MLLRFVPRVLVCLLLPLALLTGCTSGQPGPQDSTPAVATAVEPSWAGGPATVRESELPAEARTLRLIDDAGPFPHARDGAVFGSLEGLLPAHKRGTTTNTPSGRRARATAGPDALSPGRATRSTTPMITTTRSGRC
ncbi:hypothetical protein FBY34_7136 [Streptomyces sp. SLBN-115]|nr:hypothetical protein FBY34_7136 [Streptomyces sp. SLBN-115]